MQPNKFISRLAALDALARSTCNEHEADLAAQRAIQLRARGLMAYAVAVRNEFIVEVCADVLAGSPARAGAVVQLFAGVWAHPHGQLGLLWALSLEGAA